MLPQDVVLIDLEFGDVAVTDLQGRTAPILEVGCVRVTQRGEVLNRFESLVKPYPNSWDAFTVKIQQLTRIDELELQAAQVWHVVYEQVQEFCGSTPLACWGYDDTYLMRRWCGYSSIRYRLSPVQYDLRTMFMLQFQKLYPGERVPNSLSAACKHLHISAPKHRGVDDCLTVLRLFESLNDLAPQPQSDAVVEPFKLHEF